jgi:DNA-binding CsgD family transcriptional regulator
MTNTDAPYFSIFENALDLLSVGIALVRSDRTIIYVNKALRGLAACSGELRIDRNTIEFATPGLRDRLTRALSALDHARPAPTCHAADFAIPRADDLPPYIVSVRRLAAFDQGRPEAAALLLVHDPLQQTIVASKILKELYALTEAEVQLVRALSTGMTAIAYAKQRRISVTTAYTHLRHTREKTGWRSVTELTRRFYELNRSLRAS